MTAACGVSNIDLGGSSASSGSSSVCTDSGDTVTNDSFTVTVNGDPCFAPVASDSSGSIILGCTSPEPGRNTNEPDVDYVTVDCTDDSGDVSADYYCKSGAVYKTVGDNGTELYGTTLITCTSSTLGESEVITSAISGDFFKLELDSDDDSDEYENEEEYDEEYLDENDTFENNSDYEDY